MEYYGKKLPAGFVYIFSRKEMKEINDTTGNCINTVYLDGTSYSESKMSKNWNWGKTAAYISSSLDDDNQLFIGIKLYGIRISNFESKETFMLKKDEMKQELINKINENIIACENNDPITKFQFISIKTDTI